MPLDLLRLGLEEARGTLSPLRCGAHARPLTLASPADRATPRLAARPNPEPTTAFANGNSFFEPL